MGGWRLDAEVGDGDDGLRDRDNKTEKSSPNRSCAVWNYEDRGGSGFRLGP